MPGTNIPSMIPVLLLNNVDPAWEPQERDEALRQARTMERGLRAHGHPVTVVDVSDSNIRRHLQAYSPHEYVVFNLCESLPGIDYSEHLVARELATMGFSFTGSSADVLALSWDKPRIKRLLAAGGVSIPLFRLFEAAPRNDWHTFPAIVKPAHEHCSLGVTREAVVLNESELQTRVRYVLSELRQPAVVEDFVDGREFHVTVWGGDELEVLPPAEIDFTSFADIHDRLCTYEANFAPGTAAYENTGLILPAPLTREEAKRLREASLAAYRAVGCRDYARMDIRLRDGVFYVLDVNPNPDLGQGTSLALGAEAAGYSYGAMGSRLVGLAARRHPRLKREGLSSWRAPAARAAALPTEV